MIFDLRAEIRFGAEIRFVQVLVLVFDLAGPRSTVRLVR